ncbi:LamG domain-containing protein [Streptomyces sp. MS191]|uniref:LamG domain-containing protein n=1 Tax=Streptomyces sp. ms191 TaxID=1827978 RepID=UPI0021C9EF81|nr:LamG domain-containing protein [Streptomyces sp. ms191]
MLDEAHQALEAAKESGQRVEVEGERGERTSVFANPDGFTFTLEQHTVPVRVARPGGGWQVPDATLERHADGTVGPKAASAVMSFSGGSSEDPLVRLSELGRTLELDWNGDLPAPELEGANAVYRNVLPDVDLKVTATVESFQQVLVVKTPEAAANPALKQLTFDLKTDGLSVRKGAAGNLAAVDGNGNTVFRSPPAQMWDSAGKSTAEPAADPSATSGAAPQLLGAALTEDEAQPAAAGDPSEQAASGTGLEPGQGDNISRMDVSVTRDSLSVVPDADMLTNTAPDAYPLFIDPTVTWGESERTLLRSDGHQSYGWGNGTDNNGQGAGKCGSWNGYYCGPGYVQKLYFEFAPDSLRGKKVLDATFRVTEPWAFQCEPRWVDLVRTNNISSSTTWSSRPAELDWLVDRYVSAGRGSECDPNAPDAAIEFNDNPGETNENLTPTVRDFAAGKFSRLTLEVRAHDEADTSAWKRFKNDAVLAVNYVAYPATPTDVKIMSGSSPVCSTNMDKPSVVDDPTPTLTSTPQTAAGGEAGAKLHAWWRVETLSADGTTWTGTGISSPTGTNFVGDNVKQTTSWPTAFPVAEDGVKRRVASLTQAFYDDGTYSQSSGYSSWCYFTVDREGPKPPTITSDGTYDVCQTNECPAQGAPDVSGTFTFGPGGTDSANKYYEYSLSEPAAGPESPGWTKLADGVTKATIKPAVAGKYTLHVRAVDTLNRPGAESAFEFHVSKGADPVAQWHFDEASGNALDSAPASPASDAILSATTVRDGRGRRGLMDTTADPQVIDKGLTLPGSTGYASTTGQVVHSEASYTVSAWVRLDDGNSNYTAISQDPRMTPDGWYSAFYLGYRADSKTWELRTSPKDATDGDISNQIVRATRPAVVGAWTHLAAVYTTSDPSNPSDDKISLFVNGRFQGTDNVAASWASTGAFQIGRSWWRGAYYDYWKGQIDEVTVWQRALNEQELLDDSRLAATGSGYQAGELIADWSAPAPGATTVADGSGYGQTLGLEGQPVITTEGIELDGADDAAKNSRPLLDDTGSFTIAADVLLSPSELLKKGVGHVGQVAGQRATNGSSWSLSYEVTGKGNLPGDDPDDPTALGPEVPIGAWQFTRFNADGSSTTVKSNPGVAEATPVDLVATFDAPTMKIALRIGTGEVVEDTLVSNAVPPVAAGSDEFTLGKEMKKGTWTNYLPATLAHLRVWAGAMTDGNQLGEQLGS